MHTGITFVRIHPKYKTLYKWSQI